MEQKYDVGGAPVVSETVRERPENPLYRPKVHYGKMIISIFVFCVMQVFVFLISGWSLKESSVKVRLILCFGAGLIYMGILGKKAVIWLVCLYQNKASDGVRLQCVFEPSCSEYMILAVEKYGVVRGVWKGIDRLRRCHPPNGGKDYP